MWKALTVLVVVQPAPVLQWLYGKHCEKAKNSLNPGWHWGALVQSASDGPEGCPRTGTPWYALSFSICPVPRLLGAKGSEVQGISGHLKLRSCFNPRETPADLQPLSASPAGAAQEGSPAN